MATALVTQIAYAVQTLFDPAGTAGRLVDLGKLANYGLLGGSAPTVWLPSELFTAGVNGVWYDPSDFTTLFQDAAGTTPVTAVEQPVGLMKDKSGRNNHAFNSSGNSANFPVLSARYNLYVNTETLATQNVTTVATSYKLAFTGTGSITLSGTATGTYSAGTHTITCTAGTLTSTVSGTVTQADLRVSNDALNQPAYQRVNTSTDYDTVGFKHYLAFNGTNQWLQTNSIDSAATDKMFVCVGFRKKSDKLSFAQMFIELSNGTNNRRVSIGQNTATDIIFLALGGDSLAVATSGTMFPAPITVVVAGIGNISGKVARLEVNSSFSIENNASQGSGTYPDAPIYIGSRAGNTFFADANFYGVVVAGKQASASEITNTKTFINQKTGAY